MDCQSLFTRLKSWPCTCAQSRRVQAQSWRTTILHVFTPDLDQSVTNRLLQSTKRWSNNWIRCVVALKQVKHAGPGLDTPGLNVKQDIGSTLKLGVFSSIISSRVCCSGGFAEIWKKTQTVPITWKETGLDVQEQPETSWAQSCHELKTTGAPVSLTTVEPDLLHHTPIKTEAPAPEVFKRDGQPQCLLENSSVVRWDKDWAVWSKWQEECLGLRWNFQT